MLFRSNARLPKGIGRFSPVAPIADQWWKNWRKVHDWLSSRVRTAFAMRWTYRWRRLWWCSCQKWCDDQSNVRREGNDYFLYRTCLNVIQKIHWYSCEDYSGERLPIRNSATGVPRVLATARQLSPGWISNHLSARTS